jgi:hypothetical protein
MPTAAGASQQVDHVAAFAVDLKLAQCEPRATGAGKHPFQATEDVGAVEAEGELEGRGMAGSGSKA